MKSFNIIEVKMHTEDNFEVLNMIDGIIVNNEVGDTPWILEVSVSEKYKSFAQKYLNQTVSLLVTITRPENEPAQFEGTLTEINTIHDALSLIFVGNIKIRNSNYTLEVLEKLIEDGYEGTDLLKEFESLTTTTKK